MAYLLEGAGIQNGPKHEILPKIMAHNNFDLKW
jgi:hypothetical protein